MKYYPFGEFQDNLLNAELQQISRAIGSIDASDGRWDDLRFPARALTFGSAPPTAESDTGFYLFNSAATNRVVGLAQMPHSWKEQSLIIPHVHWQKTTSATGNVLWQLDYEIVNNGSVAAMTYASQEQVSSPVSGTPDNDTANEVLISSFGTVDMTGYEISCLILFKLSRIGGDASDTYGANCRLLEFDIHYQTDTPGGSPEQYSKND